MVEKIVSYGGAFNFTSLYFIRVGLWDGEVFPASSLFDSLYTRVCCEMDMRDEILPPNFGRVDLQVDQHKKRFI